MKETKNELETEERKIKIRKEKQYVFWKDENLIWTCLIFFTIFLLTISFLNIRGLTTIHSYTINVLFGMFSTLLYVWFILFCLQKLFKLKKTYSYNIFHFSLWRLALFFFAILIFGSLIYYIQNGISNIKSSETFKKVFEGWFTNFKKDNDPALPYKYTSGLVGAFCYALISILGNKVGIVFAFIFAIAIAAFSVSTFFISDLRFQLMSFSKVKRQQAKKTILNQKTTNIKVKSETTNNLNQNINKIQIESVTPINDTEISNEEIEKTLEKTKTISINIPTEAIEENIPTIVQNVLDVKEQPKPYTLSNTIAQNDLINNELSLDFDENPFDNDTNEMKTDSTNMSDKLLENSTALIDENSNAENYLSKFVKPIDLKQFEQDIEKTIDLEIQEKEIESKNLNVKANLIENNVNNSKDANNKESDKKNIRYSLIDDKDDLF
ncbi:hypothetical protein [Metamycoplasma buccale]|uniref:hypothetical protein n=1 Tax=Metamycoplasma buccale TaxID=55602 RepID=UPI00398F775D